MSKNETNNIKKMSIPCDFHVCGTQVEGTISKFDVGVDTYYPHVSTNNQLKIACPSLFNESILLSMQIKFDATEPNKFFRIGCGNTPITDLNEIKRQTSIINGGIDKIECSSVLTQLWNIPLHLVINPDRYFYLNIYFDTVPLEGFEIKNFTISGLAQVGSDYEYKNIK